MDPIGLALITVIIINAGLGIALLTHRTQPRVGTVYVFNILTILAWIWSMYFYRISSPAQVFLWAEVLYISATLIASSFLYFTYIFPVPEKVNYKKKAAYFFIPNALLILLIIFSDSILTGAQVVSSGENILLFGPLYFLYVLYILTYFLYGFYRLFAKYKQTQIGRHKNQLLLLFIGYSAAGNIAFITNLILPWIGVFELNWLGQIASLAMVSSAVYAILKHELFDLKVVSTEFFTFALWVFLLIRTILSETLEAQIINGVLFTATLIIGVLLIRSVQKEVSAREQLQKLTGQLRQANADLMLRNRYLASLQELTNEITRSLDFGKVTQKIVDGLSTKLNYVGGYLVLLDKDQTTLKMAAMTHSRLIHRALSYLPKPADQYQGNIKEDNTLTILAMRTGRVQIGSDLHAFLGPDFPKGIISILQSILRVRSVMAVPIFAENNVKGCLVVITRIPKAEIDDTQVQMMKALADEVGIVTRNLELYDQLDETNKKLVFANKELARLDKAKTEFLSIASHQLRTPLTAIKGYLSMIKEGDFGKIPKKMNEPIDEVHHSAERLIALVNELLDVSRIASGRMELHIQSVNMKDLVLDVIDELKPKAEDKKVKLNFEVKGPSTPMAKADDEKLRQVVTNLIDNAIKYSEGGSADIVISKQADKIRFSVKDSGIGITPEELPRLFQRFVRTKEAQLAQAEGTGLGLYVAKNVVHALGGKIWAESEGLGKGSTFIFEIPEAGAKMSEQTLKVDETYAHSA